MYKCVKVVQNMIHLIRGRDTTMPAVKKEGVNRNVCRVNIRSTCIIKPEEIRQEYVCFLGINFVFVSLINCKSRYSFAMK